MDRIPGLQELQQWMQEEILRSGTDAESCEMANAEGINAGIANVWRADDVLLPSLHLSAEERLDIYRNAYAARLIECLSEEFESVQKTTGEEAFQQLAIGYFAAHPAESYTLSDLGRKFPEYLLASRPEREGDAPDWADFLIDLARLERTYAEVFDGRGSEERVKPFAQYLEGQCVEGGESLDLSKMKIALCPSVRLLKLKFPVHEYASELRQGTEPGIPEPREVELLISRRDYIVRREEISTEQAMILRSLANDEGLENALHQVLLTNDVGIERLASIVRDSFEKWMRQGILVDPDGIDFKTSD